MTDQEILLDTTTCQEREQCDTVELPKQYAESCYCIEDNAAHLLKNLAKDSSQRHQFILRTMREIDQPLIK